MNRIAVRRWAAMFLAALIWVAPGPRHVQAQVARVQYESNVGYLVVEFLDDDLVHFELSAFNPGPSTDADIYTTPMIHKTDYAGPSSLADDGAGTLETLALKVEVELDSLCVTLTDKAREPDLRLSTICPLNLDQPEKGITLTQESFTHAYGLGQVVAASADINWVGRVRVPGGPMGNAVVDWNEGGTANTQFPVLYLAGQGTDNYALFLDNAYRQGWNLSSDPWRVTMRGDWVRFYVLTGPDLPDLRQDYMELIGRPPVPPLKMFGLWISEFGYEDWAELEDKLETLRANHFPVDGFVLDLQWFGGIRPYEMDSPMGGLEWDQTHFPDPEQKIAYLRDAQGVGIMVIEESYVSRDLPTYEDMRARGYLVRREKDGAPVSLIAWWGVGGMVDWSNPDAASYWHDWKREPLIAAGVIGHWTDLGEPDTYDAAAWYEGITEDYRPLQRHGDVHNLYNLFWSRSIYEGYARSGHTQRPFILSRSGAPGSQRYGVAMWSGDLSSRASSLIGQLEAQLHMSFSGIDYYGGDIGGLFHNRIEDPALLPELYTQWFANGMAFDLPARPHVNNYFECLNCYETAPDRMGDPLSNLENVRQRYELRPYLYSLAHRAYLYGEPVMPPLVYYYQTDPVVRSMAHEKLLGRDLLVAVVAGYGETERGVYLPAGTWINYHTNEWFYSTGQWFDSIPEYIDGRFKLPMFARAGAIIPQMYVDEQTMNVEGRRSDGSTRDELIVRVFAGPAPSQFTLYEDDGQTIAYQSGAVRATLLSQRTTGNCTQVNVGAASGTYDGALTGRDNVIELVAPDAAAIQRVQLNGHPLVRHDTQAAFDAAPAGWYVAGPHLVLAKSGSRAVAEPKTFAFCRPNQIYNQIHNQIYLPVVIK